MEVLVKEQGIGNPEVFDGDLHTALAEQCPTLSTLSKYKECIFDTKI